MSECFGGTVCTIGDGPGPDPGFDWDWYFGDDRDGGGGGGGRDRDGGGGGGGGDDSGGEPAFDTHQAADFVTAAARLKAALNSEMLQKGLTTAQKTKIGKIIKGIDEIIDKVNAGTQFGDHLFSSNWTAAMSEAIGFLAAAGLVTVIGSITSSATVLTLVGIVTAYTVETLANEVLDAAPDYYNDWLPRPDYHNDDYWGDFKCNATGGWDCDNWAIPPIAIDLDGDGVEFLSKKESQARLDMDNDGFQEKVSWVSADDGLLALDFNGSGTIDELSEISFARLAGAGSSDLEGLRTLDTNQDNIFDQADDAYAFAYIWQDLNSNGVQERGELTTLAERNIAEISLKGQESFTFEDDVSIVHHMTYTMLHDGRSITGKAADVVLYGNLGSGIKELSDSESRVELHENGKNTLDLSMQRGSDVVVGEDSYFGVSQFYAVQTGKGHDTVEVVSSNNIKIETGKGHDSINVRVANSLIEAGAGKDQIYTGSGNDRLVGNQGNDVLSGGTGKNMYWGGEGKDTFIVGQGKDVIMDFEPGVDSIELDGIDSLMLEDSIRHATSLETGVRLDFTEDKFLIFHGMSVEYISDVDFVISE
ncbi:MULTISPECIES: calcium-binding protein [Pseudoalteromonas]|uniref:Haemolysin-type calcium binding-related domain-containing protein n=1 Tax=Pseudoalteromonas amylolytica TaxID=1859457 RepID=A0A1S1MSI7_9GAMM|nr:MULTISPECIES: calcium-binding protein [Pseudoalteromonas]OHU86199.1 hypothetical protein BFC16_15970 [Pseudoalteromonas sp. JW3]OHU89695.1 hypothetical protein BET10_16350 [Pseudoalteromonas amylolytica]